MIRAAVIGAGDIARIHIPALQHTEGVELAAVCDTDESRRTAVPAGVAFYTDYHTMIREIRPDSVHLCLPHYLHYPVAAEAAKMGVHVFCEKPVAMNTEEALAFARLERQNPNLHMGICLQNRYNRTVETLRKLLQSGAYGAVRWCRGTVLWHRSKAYYDAKPWRGTRAQAGGGCMINQSVHTLDLLYYLCGEVESLHGTTAQLLDYGIEVEDTVSARLRFAGGATGLFCATNANGSNEAVQMTVATEQAAFIITDGILYRETSNKTRERLCEDERLPGVKHYYGAGHVKLIGQYYLALQNRTDDYIHVRDAVMSIRLIDAIHESQKTGKPVQISRAAAAHGHTGDSPGGCGKRATQTSSVPYSTR